MLPETFEKIMEKLGSEIKSIFFYGKGEATLSPHLPDLTELAADYGCDTRLSINTCVPLKKPYLSRLLHSVSLFKICVDGWNQETLSKYRRGGKWQTLLKNLQTISEINPCHSIKEMCVLTFKYVEGNEDKFRQLHTSSRWIVSAGHCLSLIGIRNSLMRKRMSGLLPTRNINDTRERMGFGFTKQRASAFQIPSYWWMAQCWVVVVTVL